MTLGTIIAIVLGIAVLVFLIFGFSSGWNNLWSKITELGGGSANVDDVARGCEVACAQNSKNAYCDKVRTVNYVDGKEEKGSCKDFEVSGQGPSVDVCSIDCGIRTSTFVPDKSAQKEVDAAQKEVDDAGTSVTEA